jgi:hypothetical protein
MVVGQQKEKKVCEIPSQWEKAGHGGPCLSFSDNRKIKIGFFLFRSPWAKSETLFPK